MPNNIGFFRKYSLVFIFICGSISFAQTSSIKINLIEFNTQNPIPDVTIILDNEIIGYTDINGSFLMKRIPNSSSKITFTHISYESKIVDFRELKNIPIVILEKKDDSLDEIVLIASKSISKKEILSNGVKIFENNIKKNPHIVTTNFTQYLSLNDSLSSFLEIDGNMILLGKNNDVWKHPILIPQQVRRTSENFSNNTKDKNITHLGMNLFTDPFKTIFRFFELRHPLSKKGNKLYNFQIEDIVTIDNEDYYLINYYSKKDDIKIFSRDFNSISGQIIINKETFYVTKTTALFRRGRENSTYGADVIFSIDYSHIEEHIYYKKINYEINSSSIYKGIKNSILQKGSLSFSHSKLNNDISISNDFFSNRYLFIPSNALNIYDKDYWKSKPIHNIEFKEYLNSSFKSKEYELLFQEGVKQTINLSTKDEDTVLKEKEILNLINLKDI